jgi:hypothetical protein
VVRGSSKEERDPKVVIDRIRRTNPYLVMTGAVLGSAASLLAQIDDSQAFHRTFERYLDGVLPSNGGGKLYSDKEPGRPCYGMPEPDLSICYMSVLVDRVGTAEQAQYSAGIQAGLSKWNSTPTTIFFSEVAYNYSANDVHIKADNLGDPDVLAEIEYFDYHNRGSNICNLGDCNDPDGIAGHQPQRWWYAYIYINTGSEYPGFSVDQQGATIAHELGHALGLAHAAAPCTVYSLMNVHACRVQLGVTAPTEVDICQVNHAGYPVLPLMYGDAWDPAHPSPTDPLHLWAYRESATTHC